MGPNLEKLLIELEKCVAQGTFPVWPEDIHLLISIIRRQNEAIKLGVNFYCSVDCGIYKPLFSSLDDVEKLAEVKE